jgi:hypothetical protein
VEDRRNNSPIVLILLAWLVVGVPFAWGVYNTLLSSMKLFRPGQTQTQVSPK